MKSNYELETLLEINLCLRLSIGTIAPFILQYQYVQPLQLSAPIIFAATLCIEPSEFLYLILPSAIILAFTFFF